MPIIQVTETFRKIRAETVVLWYNKKKLRADCNRLSQPAVICVDQDTTSGLSEALRIHRNESFDFVSLNVAVNGLRVSILQQLSISLCSLTSTNPAFANKREVLHMKQRQTVFFYHKERNRSMSGHQPESDQIVLRRITLKDIFQLQMAADTFINT